MGGGRGGGAAAAEFFAKFGEHGLLGGREVGELGSDGGGDFREEGGDASAAGFGERHDPAAGVGAVALSGDETVALKVGKNESEIAGAFEDFLGDLAGAKGAAVVERLEDAELGDGEVAEKTVGTVWPPMPLPASTTTRSCRDPLRSTSLRR